MTKFIEYINQFEKIDNGNIGLLTDLLKKENFKKDEYFLEAGRYCNKIGFVINGVFRIFFYDKEGNEITRYFLAENHFLIDLNAFNHKTISSDYIQSLTDSDVIIIDRPAFVQLQNSIKNWDRIVQRITESALLEKVFNRSELLNQDATTRYLQFLEKYPSIINRIPLGHLASYLGIKQQSLSRIRKEISSQ